MARRPRETPRDAPGVCENGKHDQTRNTHRCWQPRPNSQHHRCWLRRRISQDPPMPRYDRHIDRIVNAQRIVGLMAPLPMLLARCFRWRCRRWRGYNVSFFVDVARGGARDAKKAVQSAVNTEYVVRRIGVYPYCSTVCLCLNNSVPHSLTLCHSLHVDILGSSLGNPRLFSGTLQPEAIGIDNSDSRRHLTCSMLVELCSMDRMNCNTCSVYSRYRCTLHGDGQCELRCLLGGPL